MDVQNYGKGLGKSISDLLSYSASDLLTKQDADPGSSFTLSSWCMPLRESMGSTDPRCEERRQELMQNSDCLYLNEAYGWINRTLYR